MKNRVPKAKAYHRDIVVPKWHKKLACVVRVRLTAEEASEVQALADQLGLTLDALIDFYVDRKLPMRPRLKEPTMKLTRIVFQPALSPETMARLQRAAAFYEESLERFIAGSIAGAIHGAEDSMLIDPRTGELIGEDFLAALLLRDVDYYRGGKEVK